MATVDLLRAVAPVLHSVCIVVEADPRLCAHVRGFKDADQRLRDVVALAHRLGSEIKWDYPGRKLGRRARAAQYCLIWILLGMVTVLGMCACQRMGYLLYVAKPEFLLGCIRMIFLVRMGGSF